ncbi:hypothetical protein LENED_008828 [Lentinula edodes]|uniref:Uncharacterized protein n=1 Tax=Lentinula edodes TaxID=5353 RepID=A0A1Q3EIA3_LENED|nr:hypothetical protein LENED_008828 [Lentinula edodes]
MLSSHYLCSGEHPGFADQENFTEIHTRSDFRKPLPADYKKLVRRACSPTSKSISIQAHPERLLPSRNFHSPLELRVFENRWLGCLTSHSNEKLCSARARNRNLEELGDETGHAPDFRNVNLVSPHAVRDAIHAMISMPRLMHVLLGDYRLPPSSCICHFHSGKLPVLNKLAYLIRSQ